MIKTEFVKSNKIKEFINSNDLRVSEDFLSYFDWYVKLLIQLGIGETKVKNMKTVNKEIIEDISEVVWNIIDERTSTFIKLVDMQKKW